MLHPCRKAITVLFPVVDRLAQCKKPSTMAKEMVLDLLKTNLCHMSVKSRFSIT